MSARFPIALRLERGTALLTQLCAGQPTITVRVICQFGLKATCAVYVFSLVISHLVIRLDKHRLAAALPRITMHFN